MSVAATIEDVQEIRSRLDIHYRENLQMTKESCERIAATEATVLIMKDQYNRIEDKLDRLLKTAYVTLGGVTITLIGVIANFVTKAS